VTAYLPQRNHGTPVSRTRSAPRQPAATATAPAVLHAPTIATTYVEQSIQEVLAEDRLAIDGALHGRRLQL